MRIGKREKKGSNGDKSEKKKDIAPMPLLLTGKRKDGGEGKNKQTP